MRTLVVAVATLVTALPASAATTPADFALASLREGCSQSYASYIAKYPAGTEAPAFAGERIKGDMRYYNDAKACTEEQYAAYLEKADPATVALAHPSAAGKKAPAKKPATAAPAKPN
ncbi:hypothetical protein [Roseateles sp. BYS96W]|uniref:Uncharacterized protein n=1 Tax=Pelomonas nitida TaxID=3299027 RepID=A0ABW7GAG2_9BURK